MTLTAVTAPLPIRVEVKNPLTELLTSHRIVVGFLVFSILIMIGVTVWSTVILLPIGLVPGHPGFSSVHIAISPWSIVRLQPTNYYVAT